MPPLLLPLAIALLASATTAAPFAGARAITDDRLEEVRGGFLLPNGMDIDLGITIDTLINGRLALSTALAVDDAAHFQVSTGAGGLTVQPNGAPVQTPWGAVQLAQSDRQSTVSLTGDRIALNQMIGAATGALVANTGSDRVIDTMVTIDLDIRHSAIPASAAVLRVDTLLAGAAARGAY